MKRVSLLALGLLLMLGTSAAAGHRKASKRAARRTAMAQVQPTSAHVDIGGDPTDPIGGLGHIPHKKSRKH